MADGDREVLSSLPRARPERRSAKRGAPAAAPAAPKPKAAAKPRPAARSKPRAVPPRKVPPAGYAVPRQGSPVNAGSTELVGTAIQAVGELANLGVSLGSRALRDILGRVPRP